MDLETCLKRCAEGFPDSRAEAIRRLRESTDAEVGQALAAVLSAADEALRDTTSELLEGLREPRTVELLLPLLRSDKPPVRNSARAVLDRLVAAAPDAVIRFSHDSDARMRIFAAGILGNARTPEVTRRLLEMLKDPDPTVQDAAVVGLGQIAAPEAVEPLAAFLAGPHPWIRLSALDALTSIGGPRAVHEIIRALGSDDSNLVAAAIDGLGRLGVEEAVEPLTALLPRAPTQRSMILRVLLGPLAGAVRLQASRPALQPLARALDEDLQAGRLNPRLRDRGREILEALGGPKVTG